MTPGPPKRTGLARALSKLGFCSRAQAWKLIQTGRVRLNGVTVRDPEKPVILGRDRVEVDGARVRAQALVYLMLNKPRGLVTTAADDQGRATVFDCLKTFRGAASEDGQPHLVAVGRLDQASEGLLLFTNDTAWANRLTDPATHLDKTYHVQINHVADAALATALERGAESEGEHLAAKRVSLLRAGEKNSWLEITLDEGRNRHLRRLLAAHGVEVMRLIRVGIGPLVLGQLPKGATRRLTLDEQRALAEPAPANTPESSPTPPRNDAQRSRDQAGGNPAGALRRPKGRGHQAPARRHPARPQGREGRD